ncbi:hypothetical protein [Rickettsiella endosymbiont of Dermanyssus gallinae]|uniref:hypothetical protein n=1 Tax=Rickettsiella endosymbiont of Dermanyssus gallinae TaxID=2856608 RepID=UPI001C531116|nr:hypothetical protein [Rickettsiella endosymbiont of Dermanyssus gallinae]
MPNTPYAGESTRVHWAGINSDQDIHLEIYQNEVDTAFQYGALFTSLSQQRSVADRSNTYRVDRLNNSTVKGRKSGISLDPQKVTNDKLVIVVDTVLYIRNPIDYQDDWTSPDWLADMGQNNGTSFAELFDNAHAIQLIKNRGWKAPDDLKPAFKDGIEIKVTVAKDPTTQSDIESNAFLLNKAHRASVEELVRRKIPLSDMVTLVSPKYYSQIIEHPKLMNADYGQANLDGFKQRRVTMMNGIPVVEFLEFPSDYGTSTNHPLGPNFNTDTTDAQCQMITFSKSRGLVTVEAKPFTSSFWDDKQNFSNVLDCYAMYTVGARRPDTTAVINITEGETPPAPNKLSSK